MAGAGWKRPITAVLRLDFDRRLDLYQTFDAALAALDLPISPIEIPARTAVGKAAAKGDPNRLSASTSIARPPVSFRALVARNGRTLGCRFLAGISCPPVSGRERSMRAGTSLVMKGSPVRVRASALRKPRKWPGFGDDGHVHTWVLLVTDSGLARFCGRIRRKPMAYRARLGLPVGQDYRA
jgi:hypothetical protein